MKSLWIGAAFAAAMASSTAHASVKVFVNGDGGRITAGWDDAGRNRSGIVASHGFGSLNVPAYAGSDAAWSRLVGCVRTQFEDFDVDIVDERPSGDYVMAMVGGSPSLLGYPKGIGGIGPYTGDVVDGAVVFVFDRGHSTERSLCETTAHEIGHALGLDHSRRCDDLMSYGQCGPKAFREEEAACGEYSDRTCGGGAATQSSRAKLASTVGLRRDPPAPTVAQRPPTSTTPVTPNPRVRRPSPTSTPRTSSAGVSVATSRARAGDVFVVEVNAKDPDGIRSVDLVWSQPGRTRRLRCGKADPRLPYTCVRRGDRYIFGLAVGAGARQFAVRVTDGKGNVRQTATSRRVFR